MSRFCVLVFSVILLVSTFLQAGQRDVLRPVSERFAQADSKEVPDFQRHVVPLLGRLGCNGRACHGSFQGRGGFRLSLFGYDFRMDHAGLIGKSSSGSENRINRRSSEKSLILEKPSLTIDHEGGKRFEIGSWEHNILKRWIEDGAVGTNSPLELNRLELEPKKVVFTDESVPIKLSVVAVWFDGRREDVTPLCRFRTNDDSVATVDQNGWLKSEGPGDTHLIAFYDNGVASIPIMRPVASKNSVIGEDKSPRTKIDQFIEAKLKNLGIRPSELCTDAEFLRRVSLDLTGTLPIPEEIENFLADPNQDKRGRKIEELLNRPSYAAWWTNKLCDFTGCNPNQQSELGQELSVQWYGWVFKRVAENMPYDELVERIVTATSRENGQSFHEYSRVTSAYFRDEAPANFVDRETMPHYWTRRTMEKPEEKALAFAHSFLGIRLQCAQCHKHPFAPWTQSDFQEFAAFVENVQFGVPPAVEGEYRQLAGKVGLNPGGKNGSPIRPEVLSHAQEGRVVPWRELYISPRSGPSRLNLLRSGPVDLAASTDPRIAIMSWMKQPDNPWFARAFVNRVWAGYFHAGIVNPPDELDPANPPSHPDLLDWLTEFVKNEYDMKWLHRQIVSSDAYQRSWQPNETNRDDRRNFSRAIPRRLPAEIVYDALKQAVAATNQVGEMQSDLSRRAIGHLSMRLAGTYAMHVFGKPECAVNCDCERVSTPTLLQSVFLQNDPLVEQHLSGSRWIAEIAEAERNGMKADRTQLIRSCWLRTVSRPPTAEELKKASEHLAKFEVLADGMRDLLWALLNTKEFILNR